MLPSMIKDSLRQFNEDLMPRHFFTLLAVSFGVLALSAPAWAYLKTSDFPVLDRKVTMPKEVFFEQSELTKIEPVGNSSLNYSVRIPRGWTQLASAPVSEVDLSAEIFTDISTFISPARGDTRSQFRVRTLKLNHMVSAENWFLNYVLSIGSTIDGILIKNDRRLEAEYTVLDGGTSYKVRASAQVSGSKIVVGEYMVPSDYAEQEHDQLIWTITSFYLTQPDTTPIEPSETYTFVDIVKFDYPQSWILYSPAITTIDRMEASLINLKGIDREAAKKMDMDTLKLDGRVDVRVISKTLGTTEQQEIGFLKDSLKQKNLEIGDLIESIKGIKLNSGIQKSQIDAYKVGSADPKLARYELWAGFLETEGRYYIITLLTVGREEDFYTWAQNIETFKFALQTLSPVNDEEDN